MKNNSFQSFLILSAYFIILLLVTLAPAQAMKTTIKPGDSIIDSANDTYVAEFDPAGASVDFYFLNITIPKGYILNLPEKGKTIGTYTMLNKSTGTNKVKIDIISNDPIAKTVDVNYSIDYGTHYNSANKNKNINNIAIGVATLNLEEPTITEVGYINITLGGAGPVVPEINTVTLKLANGILKNPSEKNKYTWFLEAKNGDPSLTPITLLNDVNIEAGSSKSELVPVFNATVPANASLPLSSGNLTVNITTSASGINVTDLVITLRKFSSDPIPDEKTGAESLSRIMFIGVDAPALRNISFMARINVSYASVLSSLTIPEEKLRLYRFNSSSSEWELTLNSGVDTVNKIVYGDVTGFSTFAIMGAAVSSGGGSSGGGGSGGAGVTTSEPFDNILKSERYDKSLLADTPVTYVFNVPELGIYEITVLGKENENDIALRVEALKGTSKLVTAGSPGIVYRNVNVWAGTKRIKEAFLRFKIENSWLRENNLAGSDAKLVKWDGSKWVQLETIQKTSDNTYSYYEAKSDTFSVFAITVLKDVSVPTQTGKETIQTTRTDETSSATNPVEKSDGFEMVIALIALSAVFKLKRR